MLGVCLGLFQVNMQRRLMLPMLLMLFPCSSVPGGAYRRVYPVHQDAQRVLLVMYHYEKRKLVSLIQTDLDLRIEWFFAQFS